MKARAKQTLFALILAILLHVLLFMLFIVANVNLPKEDKRAKYKEKRMKISLKEQPKVKKEALVKNSKPKSDIAPPMPKGKQLKKIVKKPLLKPTKKVLKKKSQPLPKPLPKKIKPEKESPKPKSRPLPQKETFLPKKEPSIVDTLNRYNKTASREHNRSRQEPPKKHAKLYSLLSKATPRPQSKSSNNRPIKRFTQQIKEAYGSEWGKLSAGEQKYILDNQEVMRRLTQAQLYETGRTDIPDNLRVNEINMVEFYLHPNGDMSDFKMIKNSNFYLLDDVTRDVIESVYSKYPRPKQKTLIRYKFWYNLRGY